MEFGQACKIAYAHCTRSAQTQARSRDGNSTPAAALRAERSRVLPPAPLGRIVGGLVPEPQLRWAVGRSALRARSFQHPAATRPAVYANRVQQSVSTVLGGRG